MKTVISVLFYLLILFCCLAGAYIAKKSDFNYELIFIVYVAMTIYAITEIIVRRISFFKGKIVLLRVLFLMICIASSYALLVTTKEMILKKELGSYSDALNMADIHMKPEGIGYLVNIKFEISNDQFLNLVNTLGFKKTSLAEPRFRGTEMEDVQYNLMNNEDTTLCFEKNETLNHSYFGTRYLIYDTKTMTAYYEYSNHKGVYH